MTFNDVQIEEKEDRKHLIFPFIPKNVTPRHREQIKGNLKNKRCEREILYIPAKKQKVRKRYSLHSSQILFQTHT